MNSNIIKIDESDHKYGYSTLNDYFTINTNNIGNDHIITEGNINCPENICFEYNGISYTINVEEAKEIMHMFKEIEKQSETSNAVKYYWDNLKIILKLNGTIK